MILLEREDIILKIIRFLRKMKKARDDKLPLVYIDETWIDSNLTFRGCWQSIESDEILQTGNALEAWLYHSSSLSTPLSYKRH